RSRPGAPDWHDRGRCREGADPTDPQADGWQQDPRRRGARHQPQDPAQQAPQVQRLRRMRLTLRARQVLALAVVVLLVVVDPTDRVMAHSNPKLEGEILPARENLERLKARSTLGIVASLFGQPEVYEAQVPMRLGERPFGTVRVGVSTSLLKQALTQAALYSLAVALVALGVVVAVGLVVGHLLMQ